MSDQERRRFPRVREPIEAQCRIDGDLEASWMEAVIINLSASGMRLRGAQPLDPGASLQLKIKLPGTPQVLELRGLVVWSQLQASTVTEVGVEFLDLTLKQQTHIDQLVSFLRTRV